MGALLPNLGNLLMAIATTWYVIFTYFILKTSSEALRYSSEPYISVAWRLAAEKASKFHPNYQKLSKEVNQALSAYLGGPALAPTRLDRFVNLEFQNERTAKVRRLEVSIKVEIEQGDVALPRVVPFTMDWSGDNLDLDKGNRVTITALDLNGIPERAGVRLVIERLKYWAVDSQVAVTGYAGESSRTFAGISKIGEAVPRIDKEG